MSMFNRLRLLPTVILCASLLLTLKLADIASGGGGNAISVAQASTPEPEAAAQTAEGEAAAEDAPETVQSIVPPSAEEGIASRLSQSETTVLESLAARREELDRRGKALDTREQLLNAAEKRVEERIAELKEIEGRINERLGAQDAENEARLAGVVSMYESMKPKDAARIFERLDMGVLIEVAKRMQPRKLSAVLAAMDPVSAQDLTVELAIGENLNLEPAAGGEATGASADPAFRSPGKAS
ncbi:MotE family protein [Parvibaculum sp.]|uniref:MotE family protein n=1 Tax=Parvibaculum sp. TaxID=2024848 RepID=UPI00391991FA